MVCVAQWEFVEWLLIWILESSHFDFDWDAGNSTKSFAKHGIETQEVEAVFRSGLALPLGIQVNPATPEQRLGVVGPTLNGKLLQIAVTQRNGKVRVISARTANKKERSLYEEILRKITEGL